tara:strand:- start:184 stop:384 length:201 start_codon:yes stop_codon:yes gene_type:complete
MAKSKIEKRHLHKKQRNMTQQLNTIVRNGSADELQDFEDGIFDSYDQNSNNYTTMRSNGEFREETY